MNERGKDNLRRMVYPNQRRLFSAGGTRYWDIRDNHRFRSTTLSSHLRSKSPFSTIDTKSGQALEMIKHIAKHPVTYGAQFAMTLSLVIFFLQGVIK